MSDEDQGAHRPAEATVRGRSLPARRFLALGALSAAIGVAAGAFGAHALRDRVEPRLLDVFETGARYQMYHAFALFAVALVLSRGRPLLAEGPAARRDGVAIVSGWCFLVGTLLFSGSLYAMTFTGIRAFGAITPLGGICFIAGWVCLAVAAMRTA